MAILDNIASELPNIVRICSPVCLWVDRTFLMHWLPPADLRLRQLQISDWWQASFGTNTVLRSLGAGIAMLDRCTRNRVKVSFRLISDLASYLLWRDQNPVCLLSSRLLVHSVRDITAIRGRTKHYEDVNQHLWPRYLWRSA